MLKIAASLINMVVQSERQKLHIAVSSTKNTNVPVQFITFFFLFI